jgi:4-amino-4-deoxy-L-arabinose transferase-like glycosyltransferase
LLLPFAGKAFHIDDPLFLWAGRHIAAKPADLFGFPVNWSGEELPMSEVTKNPPLTCYFIALVGSTFGWSEIPLHLGFLIWPAGVIAGTYVLSRRFEAPPVAATLATLFTPVFLVSATNLMCDVMMVCFWIWAVILWDCGLREGRPWSLPAAGALIGLCALTKYFGITLIPLLVAYTLALRGAPRAGRAWERRGFLPAVLALLIPVLMLAAYELWTRRLYGTGMVTEASEFPRRVRELFHLDPLPRLLVGLSFLGGSVVTSLCYLPFLWSRRALVALVIAIGIAVCVFFAQELAKAERIGEPVEVRWLYVAHVSIFCLGGASLLALGLREYWERRDAPSLLLFLWLAGTYAFAGWVNWTVNGRSMLPLVPAAAILMLRRIDQKGIPRGQVRRACLLPILPAALLSLAATWGDYCLAGSARAAVDRIYTVAGALHGTIWFQGHWGFQYYMQQRGARPVVRERLHFEPGDVLVLPRYNTGLPLPLDARIFRARAAIELPACRWITTMNPEVGAGFYSDLGYGPMPFAIGPVPLEGYQVLVVGERDGGGAARLAAGSPSGARYTEWSRRIAAEATTP